MRIATLMINGFGRKLPKLRDWLKKEQPDIVALQKIGNEAEFPESALRKIGYHSAVNGKAFPMDFGVAVLTRTALGKPQECFRVLRGAEGDGARLLTVEIAGLLFSSIYAPYGPITGIPTRRIEWLQRLREHLHTEGYAGRDSLLCGDFNVKSDLELGWKGDYTRHEQRELKEIYDLGLCDLYRCQHRDPHKMRGFTFGFTKTRCEGKSRLHLAIASKRLARRLVSACVDTEVKIREKARPLVVDFADPDE